MHRITSISKIVSWAGLVIVLYMLAILTSETGKNYQLRSKSDELEGQISQMQSQIEELGYKVTYYRTDAYQERLAREKLGLQKPGETVVSIKKDTASTQGDGNGEVAQLDLKTDEQLQNSKSHWQQWREFLFGS